MSKWNEQQLQAINSTDKNTLVSASAGSGKTAVTIERLIRLIKDGTPVRRIVMLAFSNAVAAELKEKVSGRLIEAIREDGSDKEYLREQIDDVAMADICTVHSFCGNLIKEYFEEVGADPSYTILEPAEKEGLLDRAVDNVLAVYGEEADPLVSSLKFFFGSDRELRDKIKRVHAFLEAQPDRDSWLKEVAASNYRVDDDAAKYFVDEARTACANIAERAKDVISSLQAYPQFDGENRVALHETVTICERAAKLGTEEFFGECAKFASEFKLTRKLGSRQVLKAADNYDGQLAVGICDDPAAVYSALRKQEEDFCEFYKYAAKVIVKLGSYSFAEWKQYGEKTTPYVEKLVEAVARTEQEYRKLKQAENKMDFSDLEYYAVKILSNPVIADEVRAKYDYVCIDEYQDTNYVQEFVLQHISNGKNLFMVGDVKQSIYQFRLTEIEIFLDKFRQYEEDDEKGRVIKLNTNYRSDMRILQFVNRVFARIMTEQDGGIDYAKTSMLTTPLSYVDDGLPVVRIRPFGKRKKASDDPIKDDDGVYSVRADSDDVVDDDASAEAEYIARKIADIVGKRSIYYREKDEVKTRLADYGDITLLCTDRSPRVKAIVEYLQRCGIPVAGANIFANNEERGINLLLNMLKIIDNPYRDIELVSVMNSVFGGFDCTQTAQIRSAYPSRKFYSECVFAYAKEKDDALARKIKAFLDDIEQLRFLSGQITASALVDEIIAKYSFDKYVLSKFGQKDYDRVHAFAAGLADKSYAVTLQSMLAYGEDVALAGETAEKALDENCVQTNTVHSSKGLEYPVVFLIDAGAGFHLKETTGDIMLDKDFGIAMKYPEESTRLKRETLKRAACSRKLEKKLTDERMRLFYVALTRAKNILYVTGEANEDKFGKNVKHASSFMDWLSNVCAQDAAFASAYLDSEQEGQEQKAVASQPPVLTFAKPDEQKLAQLKNYFGFEYPYQSSTKIGIKHTVTGINKDAYASEQQLPVVSEWFAEDSANVGTAYHKVLENIDYDCHSEQEVALCMDEMLQNGIIDKAQRDYVNPSVIFRCLCSDIMIKARACEHIREKQFMLYMPACELTDTDAKDKILVQGTADLLIRDGDGYILVDFKMSKKPPELVKSTYAKQLEIYALAVEKGMNAKVNKKIIYILGQDVTIEV